MHRSREFLTDKLIISDFINQVSGVSDIAKSKYDLSMSINAWRRKRFQESVSALSVKISPCLDKGQKPLTARLPIYVAIMGVLCGVYV